MFRATKINIYIRFMRSMGVSATRLLSGTNINPKEVSMPGYLISLEQYETVVSNMVRLTSNTGIGFQLADFIKPTDFGIVGYALMSSSSLRQALRVWMEYSNSLVGSSIRLELIDDRPPGYTLTFTARSAVEAMRRFETEELLIGMRMIPMLTGVTPVVESVCFAYSKPAHSVLYDDFFKCPIQFDTKQTILVVKTPDLDVQVQTGNDELFEVCAMHCQQVMRSIPQGGLMRSQLRSIFSPRQASCLIWKVPPNGLA